MTNLTLKIELTFSNIKNQSKTIMKALSYINAENKNKYVNL